MTALFCDTLVEHSGFGADDPGTPVVETWGGGAAVVVGSDVVDVVEEELGDESGSNML